MITEAQKAVITKGWNEGSDFEVTVVMSDVLHVTINPSEITLIDADTSNGDTFPVMTDELVDLRNLLTTLIDTITEAIT